MELLIIWQRRLTFWLMKSSSSPLIPNSRFIFLASSRCVKTLRSISRSSFRRSSRVLTNCRMTRAPSSSILNLRSFSALCASLFRVFRICRNSLLRKHTYGSASSLSAPVSNFRRGDSHLFSLHVRLPFQCSNTNLAYVLRYRGMVSSYCSSSSSRGKTGELSTEAKGCFA